MSDLAVQFFGSVALPDNSEERRMNQIACHIFLLTLALVNVVYYIFVVGLGTGSLKKNGLQQLAFLGALMQIGSCSCSITRYNIGDEYNTVIGNWGAVFGLLSGIFNNCALSTIWFHGSPSRQYQWGLCCAVIAAASIIAMIMELLTYQSTHFFWFRIINMQNTPYTGITVYFTYRALKSKKINIDSSIIKHEDVTRLFLVLSFFELFWFLTNVSGVTLFIYIGGGLTFGVVNVATFYMGLFDDYYGGSPDIGEFSPLLG